MNEYQNCIIGYSTINQTPIYDYNLMVYHKINNSNNELDYFGAVDYINSVILPSIVDRSAIFIMELNNYNMTIDDDDDDNDDDGSTTTNPIDDDEYF